MSGFSAPPFCSWDFVWYGFSGCCVPRPLVVTVPSVDLLPVSPPSVRKSSLSVDPSRKTATPPNTEGEVYVRPTLWDEGPSVFNHSYTHRGSRTERENQELTPQSLPMSAPSGDGTCSEGDTDGY